MKSTSIGYFQLNPQPDKTVELQFFFLYRQYRGKGFGTMMAQALLTELSRNYRKVTLVAQGKSIRFWMRQGFNITDRDADVVYMQKELN